MTITPERLAELDAVYAKQAGTPFGENWIHLNMAAKHHIFAAYPDLRAHIDAQAATIAGLREALADIAGSHWERFGMDQTDVEQVPDMSADEAMNAARDALSYDDDQPALASTGAA